MGWAGGEGVAEIKVLIDFHIEAASKPRVAVAASSVRRLRRSSSPYFRSNTTRRRFLSAAAIRCAPIDGRL